MINNGIKSMTNYANNYPPHINAIQQMVTQVITIPYQHTTCHCFSQFFFHKHFVLPLISFHTMPLTYISTLCFYSFFLGLWPHFILSLFRLSASSFFLYYVACFFKSYNNTRTMEMQIYAMDTCFQISQGGRKETDGLKR